MYAIRGMYDGKTIIPLEHITGRPHVEVIITFLDDLSGFASREDETESLLALSGTWEDARPVEAIVSDIYESRTVSRENITL